MPTSVRVAVVLVVLGVWTLVVGAQTVAFFLGRADLPNVALLGVPGAVVLAVAPWPSKRKAPVRKPRAKPITADAEPEDETP
jgi:hypothetical protein